MNPSPFTRQSARYAGDKIEASLIKEFDNIYRNGQPRSWKVFTATPLLTDLIDGESVISDISGVRKIVSRINGALYHVTLTAGA